MSPKTIAAFAARRTVQCEPCDKCRRLGKSCSTCLASRQPPLTIPLQIAVAVAKATKETES